MASAALLSACKTKQNNPDESSIAGLSSMLELRNRIAEEEESALAEYHRLIDRADRALSEGPYSVMNKKGVAASGDKHDYLSLAPYWWPDPDSPDGLPWIRKDGQVNPETRGDYTDFLEMRECFRAISDLSRAYFYSGDKIYAEKAVQLLENWFINPETRMNPNHDFAQAIPGLSNGRPAGTIEMGGIGGSMITSVRLLKKGGALPYESEIGFKTWLTDYLLWYQTSEVGLRAINDLHNNIGTMCDVKRINILIYLERIDEVKEILNDAREKRIAKHIEPDGKMPRELARTKSFTYSTGNLRYLTRLASFGKKYDVDLWNFESSDGRSIKKAYEFLIPYIATDKEWEYQQITSLGAAKTRFANLLLHAGKEFDEPEYIEIAQNHLNRN